MLFTFSETSNFDDAPKWDEAQRETVNRNLSIEFDAENTTHETDTTDDASAINRNQKFNQSKVCLTQIKVEKILKGSLGSIPSPLPSVKIQVMGGKVCLRCNAWRCQQTFENKKFVDITQQCFSSSILSLQ